MSKLTLNEKCDRCRKSGSNRSVYTARVDLEEETLNQES